MKKTLSSSVRVQRGLISPPMMVSAADDDNDNAGGKRHTPANGNQRARTTSVGSRATPPSLSKPPSTGLFSTAREVEVVVGNSGGSSKGRKEKDKEKGKGMDDMGKWQTRPAEEEKEDEDAPQAVHLPKRKPLHSISARLWCTITYTQAQGACRPGRQTARTEDEVKKQAPAQRSGPPRRAAKVMAIGSQTRMAARTRGQRCRCLPGGRQAQDRRRLSSRG